MRLSVAAGFSLREVESINALHPLEYPNDRSTAAQVVAAGFSLREVESTEAFEPLAHPGFRLNSARAEARGFIIIIT